MKKPKETKNDPPSIAIMRKPSVTVGVPALDEIGEKARRFFVDCWDGLIDSRTADAGLKTCQIDLIKYKMATRANRVAGALLAQERAEARLQ